MVYAVQKFGVTQEVFVQVTESVPIQMRKMLA